MTTVILKLTEACNARCAYCDVVRKPRPPVVNMPMDVLEQLFVRTGEFLRGHPEESMCVVWHGGEPLLMGTEPFVRALEFQQRHCGDVASRIVHSIQTNATLLTAEFVPVLRELGIDRVGTSYDPVRGLRGLGRERDPERYDRKFMEGLRVLEEAGMPWGVIYVVTRSSLADPAGVYRTCMNLASRGSVRMNPVLLFDTRDPELSGMAIDEDEWVGFQARLFPVWWAERHLYPDFEPFASAVRNVSGRGRSLCCTESGRCALSHLNLAPDGTLSLCGRASDWGLFAQGSIMVRDFDQVLADPERLDLLERSDRLAEGNCRGCRFWDICHGGCPLDGWAAHGSLMRETGWCRSTRAFLQDVVEPALAADRPGAPPVAAAGVPVAPRDARFLPVDDACRMGLPPATDEPCWINPVGGLGDILMLSGVLRQVLDREPDRRFRLVRRTKYIEMLGDHPAFLEVGYPPPGAVFRSNNYWDHPAMGRPGGRAFQCLASMFGLPGPVPEVLWVPWRDPPDPGLLALVPWQAHNVVIGPASDSPRKCWDPERWEQLVAGLRQDGIGVVQVGRLSDPYVRGAFDLRGLTTPRSLLPLLPCFSAAVTVDSFLMHAAHLASLPAAVIWGPTDHRVLGYAGHLHMQGIPRQDCTDQCLGPGNRHLYGSACPRSEEVCTHGVTMDAVRDALDSILARAAAASAPAVSRTIGTGTHPDPAWN